MKNLPDFWRQNTGSPSFRDNPFRDLQALQKQLDRMWDGLMPGPEFRNLNFSGPAFTPSCDIEETESHYLMSFDLPGVKKENIKINLADNQLTVSGERTEERSEKSKGRSQSERIYGSFERSFTLPATVKAEQIEASYSDGVLRVAVPKLESAKAREVKVGDGKPSAWNEGSASESESKSIPLKEKKSA